MLTEKIKKLIDELFDSTPSEIGVGYGKKKSNGVMTDKESIIFFVPQKKPLHELNQDEILPNEPIEIDGKILHMDVIEVGVITTFACNPQCVSWQTSPPPNRGNIRPIKGGISITSKSSLGTVGTLGFIAVDTLTQSLVGVTNNHVVIEDPFFTTYRDFRGVVVNEYNLNDGGNLMPDIAYQPGESSNPSSTLQIGQVIRYVPIHLTGPSLNKVDGALISLSGTPVLSLTQSYLQYNLTGNTSPIPFATTAEIDSLLTTNPILYKSARTTGVLQAPTCPLRVYAIGYNTSVVGFKLQGVVKSIPFRDCIAYVRPENDPDLSTICPYPIAGGDSGSCLVADFNGTWKIVGLNFAGGGTLGIACRIDHVASELGIEAWDGSLKNLVDPSTITFKTISGASSSKTVVCDGETFWQMGLTSTNNNCN